MDRDLEAFVCARASITSLILGDLLAHVYRHEPSSALAELEQSYDALGVGTKASIHAIATDQDGLVRQHATLALQEIFSRAKTLRGERETATNGALAGSTSSQ